MKKCLMLGGLVVCLMVIIGCGSQTCIVAGSQTVIGIEAYYDQKTEMPYGRVAYARNEIAIVPTNRLPDCYYESDTARKEMENGGAKDTGNVLMEINFTNWFCFWKDQAVYQRLAVGDSAVSQPGAAIMFAKTQTGTLDKSAIDALKSLGSIKTVAASDVSFKKKLIDVYVKDKDKVNKVLTGLGFASWDGFLDGNPRELTDIEKEYVLKELGLK